MIQPDQIEHANVERMCATCGEVILGHKGEACSSCPPVLATVIELTDRRASDTRIRIMAFTKIQFPNPYKLTGTGVIEFKRKDGHVYDG